MTVVDSQYLYRRNPTFHLPKIDLVKIILDSTVKVLFLVALFEENVTATSEFNPPPPYQLVLYNQWNGFWENWHANE